MDWADTDSIAIQGCASVAIYDDGQGCVVITQRAPVTGGTDDHIVIPFDRLEQFIAKLQRFRPEE